MKLKKKKDSSLDRNALHFRIRESYKTARTNIDYSIIKKGCKKIAFTSTSKGEGKTLTSMNVASALAQKMNTRVLVIECDLRRPHVHVALQLDPNPGITNYLNNECSYEDVIKPTHIPNLNAVCYGAIPPNPSELLASEPMKDFIKRVEKEYDYIIFDTPPIGVVIDAAPILKSADGVVLVAKNNSTTYPQLSKTIETVTRAGGKPLGVIVNQVRSGESRGKSNYGYEYGYGYGY